MRGAQAGDRIVYMKNARSGITQALLVLIPPMIGTTAYFAPFRYGFQDFFGNSLYIASGSMVWWPCSLFLKKRTFLAGLLGIHAMMAWFLYAMSTHWGDDLGWILYLPNLLFGCLATVTISEVARKANEWIHRTPR
jgi:hypothetical protein